MKLIRVDAAGHGFCQGSETWKKIRAGKITGSEVHEIMGVKGIGKGGFSYIEKLVAEEYTMYFDFIETPAMRWGKENEPIARQLWARLSENLVEEIPFIHHDYIQEVGFSTDGLSLQKRFFIEIKCPYTIQGHLKNLQIRDQETLKKERNEYYWQIQFGLWITGFETAYYVSFDPRWPDTDYLYQINVKRNENDIILMQSRINEAIELKNSIISSARLTNFKKTA